MPGALQAGRLLAELQLTPAACSGSACLGAALPLLIQAEDLQFRKK